MKATPKEINPKLRELILYIASRSEADPLFGKVKINKLLFYSDFFAHLHLGKSITGEEYQVLQQGPAPRSMLPALTKMESKKEIAVKRDDDPFSPHKIFALATPDISSFSAAEIDIVNRCIDTFRGVSGTELSDRTHQFIGWVFTPLRGTIPYSMALIGSREPTLAEREMGKSLVSRAEKYFPTPEDASSRS